MKRFFFVFGILVGISNLLVPSVMAGGQVTGRQVAGQQGTPNQIPAMGSVSRDEIKQVLDSPDFKQLSNMMGIPIDKMSDAEKEALISETEQFAKQIEQMPPQEQEKLMQDIFSQMPQAEQVEKKAPEQKPEIKPEPKKTPEKETKQKISTQKIETNKELVKKLAKTLEKVELKFDSLLQASPDVDLERNWAGVKGSLPWPLAALHRLTNSQALLERLSSDEYRVLIGQISDLRKQLKPLNKKFKTSDTAKLRNVEGMDAARAELISDQEKEVSKRAATKIIQLLSGGVQPITFGIKGMLERYDREALAEIEKIAKQKAPAKLPDTKGSMYKSDGSRSSGGSHGRDYPSSYGGGYGGYDRPYTGGGYEPAQGSTSTGDGSSTEPGKMYATDKNKKDEMSPESDKTGTSKGGTKDSDKGDKKQSLEPTESQKLYKDCTKKIGELEKLATELLTDENKATLQDAGLKAPTEEKTTEITKGLQKINAELEGLPVKRFLAKTENMLEATQKQAKIDVGALWDKASHLATLAKLARRIEPRTVSDTQSEDIRNFFKKIKNLTDDFLTPYTSTSKQLRTQERLKAQLAKEAENLAKLSISADLLKKDGRSPEENVKVSDVLADLKYAAETASALKDTGISAENTRAVLFAKVGTEKGAVEKLYDLLARTENKFTDKQKTLFEKVKPDIEAIAPKPVAADAPDAGSAQTATQSASARLNPRQG